MSPLLFVIFFFFFNDTATTEIYTLSLHDALPISVGRRDRGRVRLGLRGRDAAHAPLLGRGRCPRFRCARARRGAELSDRPARSEEHTSELQSRLHLVCRLLLGKKTKTLQLDLFTT